MGRGYNDGKYDFDPNPNNVILICPECGTKFEPRTRNQKYCCDPCRRNADKRRRRGRKKKGKIVMTDSEYKEVYFDEYCKTCKHKDLDEKFDPCNECLDEPMNIESHKPVKWEEDK